jgi:hypothetical protein
MGGAPSVSVYLPPSTPVYNPVGIKVRRDTQNETCNDLIMNTMHDGDTHSVHPYTGKCLTVINGCIHRNVYGSDPVKVSPDELRESLDCTRRIIVSEEVGKAIIGDVDMARAVQGCVLMSVKHEAAVRVRRMCAKRNNEIGIDEDELQRVSER